MKLHDGREGEFNAKAAEDYYYAAMNEREPEPSICKQHGCARHLNPTEKLYSDYCFNHSPQSKMSKENLYEPGCIRTFTGIYVNVLDPTPDMICIEDIAHSLAQQVRFGGHLPQPFTVGQHSLWCCHAAKDEHKLAALLHDASEAYLRDLDPHLKNSLPEYQTLEARYMTLIAEKFGFQYPFHPDIKKIDIHMLEKEWECIMLGRNNEIPVYDWHKTKIFFLTEFKRLKSA